MDGKKGQSLVPVFTGFLCPNSALDHRRPGPAVNARANLILLESDRCLMLFLNEEELHYDQPRTT